MANNLGLDKDGQQKHLSGFDYFTDSLGQFALNSCIPLAMFALIFLFRYDFEEKLPAIIRDNERMEAELAAKGE